jgi:predicted DNA-binding protein YlxM (UPF0122 family)
MEDFNYVIKLYDYYGELLTDKARNYFEDYYFNDLSFSEIAENENVSKNAVFKNIKNTVLKLEHYESILKLIEKNKVINDIIKELDDNIKNRIKELI